MFNRGEIKALTWEELDGVKCKLKHFKDKENGELLVAVTEDKKIYILDSKIKFEERRCCI